MKRRVAVYVFLTFFLSAFPQNGLAESPFPQGFPVTNPSAPFQSGIPTSTQTLTAPTIPGTPSLPALSSYPYDARSTEARDQLKKRTPPGAGQYDRTGEGFFTYTLEEPLSMFEEYVWALNEEDSPDIADTAEKTRIVSTEIRQFGYDLFRHPPSTFAPMQNIPVGPDYILGPGDEIRISIWGSVNGEFALIIDSEGKIALPYIGILRLSGLSFSEAKEYVIKEFRRQYKAGQVKINVTTGRLRSLGVFVVGKAKSPGSYTISSLSTLVNALFASGGPDKSGSMRDIQVKRNGKTVTNFDFYDFLLSGDKTKDVRLMPEDVIFIPSIGPLAGIAGNVNLPAIYELKSETSLEKLIALAGGLNDIAFTGRVQIVRIVDNNSQVILEYDLDGISPEDISIQSGDVVKVYPIVEDPRLVRLSGAVQREGEYGFSAGMTVKNLITLAGGLKYYAYGDEAELIRVTPTPKGPVTEKILLSPEKALADDQRHNLQLEPDDSLLIKAVPEWELYRQVTVSGEVKFPGTYTIKKGEKLSSLIERAGLTENSYLKGTVFTRKSVRELQQRQLEEAIDRLEQQILSRAAAATETALSAESVAQEKAASEQRMELLAKLRSARAKGRLTLDFELARRLEEFKDSPNDLVLEEGDTLAIPEQPAQVQVIGAVYNQNAFIYNQGNSVASYIKLSGGMTKDAAKKEIYVLKVDGTAISKRETGSFMRRKLDPGDTIVVPEKIDKAAVMRNIKDITQILYQIAVTAGVLIVAF